MRDTHLISWKYSLERINGELELALKKKQVLDKLFHEGKVSQPTYDSFSDEVADAITEIEIKQKTLAEKMKAKIHELEQQIKTLEFLLVNSEIRHVSGESEEEAYDRECNMLSLGLETTRRELDDIKEAIANLSGQSVEVTPVPTPPEVEEEAEPKTVEPEHEKRIEIIMDTETTTSIETTVEEQSRTEPPTEALTDTATEQEEKPAATAEEATKLEATAEEEKQEQG